MVKKSGKKRSERHKLEDDSKVKPAHDEEKGFDATGGSVTYSKKKSNKSPNLIFLVITAIIIVAVILYIAVSIDIFGVTTTDKGNGQKGNGDSTPPVNGNTEIPKKGCNELCEGAERCIIRCENQDVINSARNNDDLTICQKLSPSIADICMDQVYLMRAINNDNPQICDNVIEEDFTTTCYDYYYFRSALRTRDITVCQKIIDVKINSECVIALSKLESEDL